MDLDIKEDLKNFALIRPDFWLGIRLVTVFRQYPLKKIYQSHFNMKKQVTCRDFIEFKHKQGTGYQVKNKKLRIQ